MDDYPTCSPSSVSYNSSMPHDITTSSPQFLDPAGDWHLQSGSAAIDAGATLTTITNDFEKNPRPTPGDPVQNYDVGACQHQ